MRPGTEVPPYQEILQRMAGPYPRLNLKLLLAKARFQKRRPDSYLVLNHFRPSLIANYNHDGLATDICGHVHRVLDMHGSIAAGYGSPSMAELVARLRNSNLGDIPDDIVMGICRSFSRHWQLARRLAGGAILARLHRHCGLQLAKSGDDYDDRVSLDAFLEIRRNFRGSIYVIAPEPDALCAMIADGIKSKTVLAVPAYWNALAHAFMRTLCGRNCRGSIRYIYEKGPGRPRGRRRLCVWRPDFRADGIAVTVHLNLALSAQFAARSLASAKRRSLSTMIHMEDVYRGKIGMPSLLRERESSFMHLAFGSLVLRENDPLLAWEAEFKVRHPYQP